MSNELKLREGDAVRLKPMIVAEVQGSNVRLENNGRWIDESLIESIISRAETPEETIARLKAELAKAPRRIEWSGGSCPTDEPVVVWHRNGKTSQAWGYVFDWRHHNETDDIIAYMVLPS